MDVRLEDGTIVTGVPEGATKSDVLALAGRVGSMRAQQGADAARAASARLGPPQDLSFAERFVAPALETALPNGRVPIAPFGMPMGSVDPRNNPVTQGLADPGTAIAQVVGGDSMRAATNAREREYQASRGEDADTFDFGRVITNIANPLAWAGGARVAAAVPNLTKSMGGRAVVNAGTGAALGALQPAYDTEDFAGDKVRQAAMGGVAGATFSPLFDLAAKFFKPLVRAVDTHFVPGGKERAAARVAREVAGPKADEVLAALKSAETFVPGSAPTAGQAAAKTGSAEFAALDRIAREIAPSEYAAIDKTQQAARREAIRNFGKDEAAVEAAKAQRAANASVNYGQAFNQAVRVDADLAKIASNPYFKEALPEAVKLAKAKKIDPKSDVTEFLHLVKLSMDDGLRKSGDGALGHTEKAALAKVKSELVDWITKRNPAYDRARQEFAKASEPINQMQVGQQLERALEPPISDLAEGSGKQRAASFATAVREAPRTIKKATGERVPGKEKLEDVLSTDQVGVVESVGKDLARKADAEELARAGMSAAREKTGEVTQTPQLTGMLEQKVTIANAVLRRLLGKNVAMEEVARRMQDPKEMAKIMEAATAHERRQLTESLVRAATGATAVTAGKAEGDSYATDAGKERSDVQGERARGDVVVQAKGDVRQQRPDQQGGGAQADTGGGVRQEAPKVTYPDAPRDPAKREKDKIYQTPKMGALKWTGEKWVRP